MARKQKLEIAFEPADAFIGITSNLSVIQLVHYINNLTFLNLVREEDLPVYSEKTDSLKHFKFYHCTDEDYRSEFCLLVNISDGINMIPALKQFTCFIIVNGAIPDEKVQEIVKQIKPIAGVQLAASLVQDPKYGIGPVLLDLELHLADLKMKKSNNRTRYMPLSEDQ